MGQGETGSQPATLSVDVTGKPGVPFEKEEEWLHIDRRISKSDTSAYIALGKCLPKDWKYVRVYYKLVSDKEIHLKIVALFREAPRPKAEKK